MAMERKYWQDQTDEDAEDAGNFRGRVLGQTEVPVHRQGMVGVAEFPGVAWEGWMTGWQETPSGSLSIRRAIKLDPEHKVALEVAVIAKGAWSQVTTEGFIFDLEAFIDAEERQRQEQAQAEEAQRSAEAAARLGLQPINGGPPRAVRRHPNN